MCTSAHLVAEMDHRNIAQHSVLPYTQHVVIITGHAQTVLMSCILHRGVMP